MMNDMMNNTVSFEDVMMADESWREESCSHLDVLLLSPVVFAVALSLRIKALMLKKSEFSKFFGFSHYGVA